MSFRLKTLLGVALIQLVVTGVMILVNQLNFGGAARAQLESRATATVQLFATMVTDAVIATDLATLDSMVRNTLLDDEIVYLHIHNVTGRTLSSGGTLEEDFEPETDPGHAHADEWLDVSAPITIGGQEFGWVELGVSTAGVEARIAEAVRWNITVAGIGIVLVAVFGTLLTSLLTRQLMSLRRGAMRLEAGHLDHRVPVQGRDELADTARTFNNMADALARDRETIRARQNDLMEKRRETLRVADAMNRISLGDAGAEVDFAERDDEIGEMARATVVFRNTMASIATVRQEQDRLIEAFERVGEQVAIFDEDGVALFMNAAFRRVNRDILSDMPDDFTYDALLRAGVAAGDFPDFADGESADALHDRMRASDGPIEIARSNDRRYMVNETAVAGIGVIVTASDVTELRASQAQVIHASKLSTLGEMATGVAHELNQPLGVIRMAAGNAIRKIARGTDDATYLTDKLERIAGQTERAAEIIDQMRIFGRKDDAVREEFDIGAAIETAAGMMRAQLSGSEIELVERLDCADCAAHGSRVMFEQVIVNLLANARDAVAVNPEDAPRRITVSAEHDTATDEAVVRVADTGGGIPDHALDRLFEPFFTTKATGEGTGIGLSISYGIIRDMGGVIGAENGPDGAVFTARVPCGGSAGREENDTTRRS